MNVDSVENISGIVLIDEIDLHLHTELQYEILPEILKSFPMIQFIVTSHSPLFLLGLKEKYGGNGFEVIDLPGGQVIDTERFREFGEALRHFRNTSLYQAELVEKIRESHSPMVFFEGDIDISYIKRAAEIFGKEEVLQRFRIFDAQGFGGLDQVWKHFNGRIADATNQRAILVYDCDIAKKDEDRKLISRRILPQLLRLLEKGIENLFPDSLVRRAREINPQFFDIEMERRIIVRDVEETIPEKWKINHQEKRNLSNWIIENAEAEDFTEFQIVFELLESAGKDAA